MLSFEGNKHFFTKSGQDRRSNHKDGKNEEDIKNDNKATIKGEEAAQAQLDYNLNDDNDNIADNN